MGHTVREVLDIWMMSPWQVLVLGLESLQLGWSPAPVLWDMEGSFVRCAFQVTEEKLLVLDHTVHVCFAPAMDTARPVILRQVFVTAETIRLARTVRSAVMGTMEIQLREPPLIASPVRVPEAQVVLLSPRQKRWCAPTVLLAPLVRDVSSVMMATLETP